MIKLEKVRPHIWHIQMDNRYELAMTFIRAQEFYESPNERFKGKLFSLLDYMEWYAIENNAKTFTYPMDWSGFNVPSDVFEQLYPQDLSQCQIPDKNHYDARMYNLLQEIRLKERGHKYYVIGTTKGKEQGVFGHEVAHGYYATDGKYFKEINRILTGDDNKYGPARAKFKSILRAEGYCDAVLDDEVQAYCATGFGTILVPLVKDKLVMELVGEIGQVFAKWEKKHA